MNKLIIVCATKEQVKLFYVNTVIASWQGNSVSLIV